jgi:pimeloyl-ACP methyl ester carboxylesterase
MAWWRIMATAAVALGISACASVPAVRLGVAGGSILGASLEADGSRYGVTWYLPEGEASALIVLEHGFARGCRNLRETTRRLVAGGLMALCVDAPMAGGNPALADALARQLNAGLKLPDGGALPEKIIVAGHSAGASFAARLGAQLLALAPGRVAGALIFDPVATPGFAADLGLISEAGRRPVLALMAAAHACNAQLNAAEALRAVRKRAIGAGRDGFIGVQFDSGSIHADVEGEDSDWLARAACGKPLPANVSLLRELAVQWAQDLARGADPAALLRVGWGLIE